MGAAVNEPIDPRFTILPHPRSTMPGTSERVSAVNATTFTATIW